MCTIIIEAQLDPASSEHKVHPFSVPHDKQLPVFWWNWWWRCCCWLLLQLLG